MKRLLFLSGCAALAAFLGAGCGHLSLSDQGDTNRELSGAAEFSPPTGAEASGLAGGLPRDASMLIRVIDEHPEDSVAAATGAMNTGLYNGQNAAPVRASAMGPQILGETTVADAAAVVVAMADSSQIPFKVPYTATDDQLRRGLNIEVRISYGGSVRYSNFNQYALTLGDVNDTHIVRVERMR